MSGTIGFTKDLANCIIVSGNLLFSIVTRNIGGFQFRCTDLSRTNKKGHRSDHHVHFLCLGKHHRSSRLSIYRRSTIPQRLCRSYWALRYGAMPSLTTVFFLLMLAAMRVILTRRNSSRRKEFRTSDSTTNANQTSEVIDHGNAFADLTDLQNRRAFRYDF
jgi:hypothetical protein